VAAGDTDDNMPDIAVSTGSADTLECLMLRIGLPASEYVAGAAGSGTCTCSRAATRAEAGGFGGAGGGITFCRAEGETYDAELSIFQPRYNAVVGPGNKPSQPWINSDTGDNTMYLSFDTPVTEPPASDEGAPNYCGRAVFSDLHVAGDPATHDTGSPPAGCGNSDLSPQEKALEFMLFDLSSCVIPDQVAPPPGVPQ
jgi:hypothetical protein